FEPKVDLANCQLVELGDDPAVALTAVELARASDQNNAAAVKAYQGKAVLLTGVVLAVQRDPGKGLHTFFLSGRDQEDRFLPSVIVTCRGLGPKRFQDQLAAVTEGQTIQVKGRANLQIRVGVDNAVLIKSGK